MISDTKDILIVASVIVILTCTMIGILSLLHMQPSTALQQDPSLLLWVIGMLAMASVSILVMLHVREIKTSPRRRVRKTKTPVRRKKLA